MKYMFNKHTATATKVCPSLKEKRVTVHLLRHTMALEMLQAGVDRAVIALWLGHESVETTQIYLEATRYERASTCQDHHRREAQHASEQMIGL